MEKVQTQPQKGGLLSGYQFSSGSVLYPMLAKLSTLLAEFENHYTEVMNMTVQGQQLNAKAAAIATKDSMDHQAAGLEDQAWAGIAGSAGSLGMTGLSFGVDTMNQRGVDGTTEEIDNAKAFQSKYEERIKSLNATDAPLKTSDQSTEVTETISRHQKKTMDVIQNKPTEQDKNHIDLATTDQANKGQQAMADAIQELENRRRLNMNKMDRWQNYLRQLNGFTEQMPRSIGNFLQSNETSAQGVQEKLKIIDSSSQDLNKSTEQQESKQFSDTASEITQLLELFSQLAHSDSYQ